MEKETIEKLVYNNLVSYCKRLKRKGVIPGNAESIASDISIIISENMLAKQQQEIYSVLSNNPKKTGDIAQECGLSSKVVSSQLIQIKSSYGLISYIKKGRLTYWYKNNELKF